MVGHQDRHRGRLRHQVPVTGRAVLVDTAVFALAVGGRHAERGPCREVIRRAGSGELEMHASVELVQELVFHRLRRGSRLRAVTQGREAAAICIIHALDEAVLA